MVTRQYTNFKGVDFSSKDIQLNRSPYSVNMWKNHKATLGECIESRPDIELATAYANTVYGIYFYKVSGTDHIIVHSGTKLYDNGVEKYVGMNPAKSLFFVYANILFIKDGINYLEYNGTTVKAVEGTIPTTTINKEPTGAGKTYQDVNMLSSLRINTFVGDGISTDYIVDAQNLDTYTEVIYVDGVLKLKGTDFTTDAVAGKITFTVAPPTPGTTGQANVSIQFSKTIPGHADIIKKCTLLSVFDNRVFFSGNIDYPVAVFHSKLDEPRYCADKDRYSDGLDTAQIKAMVAGNSALWVFKEPSPNGNSVYYHRPVIDEDYGKTYPNEHSNISGGCIATGINFNDDLVFFSNRGMEAINGDISSEQLLAHRSSLVDSKLLAEANYKNMILEEYEGYLLVIIGNKVYLADSRQIFQLDGHTEYEWYYWELSKSVTSTMVHNGVLYIGSTDGVYTLTKTTTTINAEWQTPEDAFGYTNMQKTTNKRGGLVDMQGDEVTIASKVDKGTYEVLGTYTNENDYVVYKLRRKKFKSLQLRLSSTKPFKLFAATIEAFVGTYIKR